MLQMSVAALRELVTSLLPAGGRFDLVATRPSPRLKTRYRPFAASNREYGVPFSLGYEDLKNVPSAIAIVLFSDVAADYYIRDTFSHQFAKALADRFGEPVCYNDKYRILRKEFAVLAGLGKIGKNALFFSRKFGLNCKIEVVLTKIEFDDYSELAFDEWHLGPCATCNECISACPVNAYDNFKMHDWKACDDTVTPNWAEPEKMCRSCITSCPASNTLLDRLYSLGAPKGERLDAVTDGSSAAGVDALYERIPTELQDRPDAAAPAADSPWLSIPLVEKKGDLPPAEIWVSKLGGALRGEGAKEAFANSKIRTFSVFVGGEGGGTWTVGPGAVVPGRHAPVAMEFKTAGVLNAVFLNPYDHHVLDKCLQKNTVRITGIKAPAEVEMLRKLVARLMFAAHGDRQFY